VCHSSAWGTDEAWHLASLGSALTGPAQIASDLERWVQMGSRAWPTSKGGNVMTEALADVAFIQLCGFT